MNETNLGSHFRIVASIADLYFNRSDTHDKLRSIISSKFRFQEGETALRVLDLAAICWQRRSGDPSATCVKEETDLHVTRGGTWREDRLENVSQKLRMAWSSRENGRIWNR